MTAKCTEGSFDSFSLTAKRIPRRYSRKPMSAKSPAGDRLAAPDNTNTTPRTEEAIRTPPTIL